jgi:hypothetical protein
MKASELVSKIWQLVEEHGDGDVQLMVCLDEDECYVYTPVYEILHTENKFFPYLISGELPDLFKQGSAKKE